MFSRKDQLLRKTGPDGIGRYDFLRLLRKEFCDTNTEEAKQQVLANLANFSYDPINYDYIRSLDIINLFLDELKSENELLVKYAVGALCNLSADFLNAQLIIRRNGIGLVGGHLSNSDEEVVADVIAALTFLRLNAQQEDANLFGSSLVERITYLKDTNCSVRIRNVAKVFLEQCAAASGPRAEASDGAGR